MQRTDKPRPTAGKSRRRTQLSEALRVNLKRRKKQRGTPEKQS